jgi:hypothetical protein
MSAVIYNILYAYDEQFVRTLTPRFDFRLEYIK